MKKKLAVTIALVLMLSMFVNPQMGQLAFSAQKNNYIYLSYGAYDKVPADEIQRAIFFGLVPKALQGNYKNQITFKEFCSLTRSMLNKYNPKTLTEWDKTAKIAVKSSRGMLRQDAYAPLMYAAEQMGVARKLGKDIDGDIYQKKIGEPWKLFTWNYPQFPIAKQMTKYIGVKFNYEAAGYMLAITKRSWLSGNMLFDYDKASNSMLVKNKLTREDAIKAVLRLAENTKYPILTGRLPRYVDISKIGTYNKNIITDKLLNASSKLPDAAQSKLPMWRGAGNTLKGIAAHGYEDYRESDVRFLAENGYNFMRIMSSYANYSYPDYPKDVDLVNSYEFEELDRIIAWGMKYGVHISILMQDISVRNRETYVMANDKYPTPEEWTYMQNYWTALAKRYKGIPSKYISFDIMNEWNPSNKNMTDQFKTDWQKVITAIRAVDPDRLLIASFDKDVEAAQAIAQLGVAVTAHPYYPSFMTSLEWDLIKDYKYPIDPQWPMQYFPSQSFNEGNAPINITGVESGGKLSIAVGETGADATVEVYGDSQLLQAVTINCPGQFNGDAVSVNIPAGIKKLTLKKAKGWLTLNCLMFEGGGLKVTMTPHDFASYLKEEGGEVNLKINSNGTWENADGKIIDANTVYEERIKPFQEVAEKNNVGFMIDEFGPFTNCVPYDNNQVVKYAADIVGLMEQKQIPYSYCELIMGQYRTIISLDGSFVYKNADLQKLTYNYDNGMTDTFWYNKKLIDAMKAKIIN